jgi:hypothetical protein
MGGDIIGYAEQPDSPPTNTFGVVIQFNTFGNTGVVLPPYNLGRTCTHEISHCFDLFHIWGDEDDCTGTDFISDTPNQAEATFGCHGFPYADKCTVTFPGIMYMNFMDYSDDACMNMFTAGQATRMLAAVNTYYPSLLTSTACLNNGIDELYDFEFRIFPDALNDAINIEVFNIRNHNSINVSVRDFLGKEISKTKIESSVGSRKIYLGNVSNGIYFVTLSKSNFKKTEKISMIR